MTLAHKKGEQSNGDRDGAEPLDRETDTETGIYVVQKHQARSLHYDLRLEVDGVLASWAVPRGPSVDPKERRLAVMVEDHPLDYADFEGAIAEGEYGAGSVMVWDRGRYRNLKDMPMAEAVAQGQVEIFIEGEKLRGKYALVRTRWGGGNNWLLIKMNDRYAHPGTDIVAEMTESVKTGRTLEEIALEASAR